MSLRVRICGRVGALGLFPSVMINDSIQSNPETRNRIYLGSNKEVINNIFQKHGKYLSFFCLVAVKRNSYIKYIFWKKGAENGQGDLCRQSKRRRGQNNHLREPGDGAGTDRGKSLSDQNQE